LNSCKPVSFSRRTLLHGMSIIIIIIIIIIIYGTLMPYKRNQKRNSNTRIWRYNECGI
jgi:hypothetical protein